MGAGLAKIAKLERKIGAGLGAPAPGASGAKVPCACAKYSLRVHVYVRIYVRAHTNSSAHIAHACEQLQLTYSLTVSFLSAHTDLNISVDVLVEACVYCSDSLFMYGKSLYHCYKSIWNH